MSDTAKSKELLTRYSVARIPFIAINTIEPSRTLDILKEISEQLQRKQYQTIVLTEVPDPTSGKRQPR